MVLAVVEFGGVAGGAEDAVGARASAATSGGTGRVVSEPWLKLYLADMRADPKIRGLNPDMRWALIQAWDLAKNGPGDVAELRRSDGRTMSERELRELSNVSPASTRRMFERWANVGLCTLLDEDGERLVVFPNLAKRQGIDRTAAERKRRQRERQKLDAVTGLSRRSHGDSHGESHGHVTAENQSTEELTSTDALGLSIVDGPRKLVDRSATTRVWSAYEEHSPQAKLTAARKQLIQRRLKDYPEETLVAAIHGNHQDPWCNGENPAGRTYHGLDLILRNADTIEKYAALAMNGTNGKPQLSPEERAKLDEEWEKVRWQG